MSVIAVYREPLAVVAAPTVRHMPDGLSLSDMAAQMHGLPPEFWERGTICINGHAVPGSMWSVIRPKPASNGVPIEVSFHVAAAGGGGDDGGGKNPLAFVAAIALTVATGWIAGGGLANAFGWSAFARGTVGAYLAAAGVSYVGQLLLASLSPTPTSPDGADTSSLKNAAASGNVLRPNAPIPRVVGTRKIYPPLICEPFAYFDGQDEVVEAVYAVAGPHDLSDIRINDAPITAIGSIEVETREGWRGDSPLGLIERFARTESVRNELSTHSVSEEDGAVLDVGEDSVSLALPQPRTVVTRYDPDEHQLQFTFPAGLNKNAGDDKYRVPLRIAMHQVGSSEWINLPEFHYQAASQRGLRATLRLVWSDDPSATPSAASTEGWVEARSLCAGQTVAPTGDAYEANEYFYLGSGDTYLVNTNAFSTGLDNVALGHYEAQVVLDRAVFTPARWEIKIQRGYAFKASDYSTSTYQFDGAVRDFYGYQGTTTPKIAQSRDSLSDSLYLMRSASIWNEHPAPTDDCGYIAIRARNLTMDKVSVLASGYVKDWDGEAWANWTITSNPAPHLRDIIAGTLSAKSIPESIVDDAELVEWRADCIAKAYEVNALIEDKSMAEAAAIVASCGYGMLRQSEKWGVVRDYDRSGETPVQIFSPRNSANFQWSKAFSDVPDAFLVTYADEAQDYESRQITVWREGATGQLMEQVTYEGIRTDDEIQKRAKYDFDTAVYRSTYYTMDVPAEAIRCRRGSLVGVQHDMLTARSGQGRVVGWELDETGDVSAIQLDDAVPFASTQYMEEVDDLSAVPDLSLLGLRTGVAIRRTTGAVTSHQVSGVSDGGFVLNFSPSISATGIDVEVLAVVGGLSEEYGRFIVFDMSPKDDLSFTLTLVDEGSELFAA